MYKLDNSIYNGLTLIWYGFRMIGVIAYCVKGVGTALNIVLDMSSLNVPVSFINCTTVL